jgi:uncharacterized protein YdhG (YjbR/CyaY superfamily)
MTMAQHFETVDEYVASFPAHVQDILQEIRQQCRTAVPGGAETISYGIPTITRNGRYVVYFAAWAHHISVYPVPDGDDAFRVAIEQYRSAKGTLKFPLHKPIPFELIGDVAARLAG